MPLTPNILQSLLNNTASAVDTKELLLQTAEEHPYFIAAHFFLLQNNTLPQSDYEKQAAKTAILFNNPFWLNFKLKESNNTNKIVEVPVTVAEEKFSEPIIGTSQPIALPVEEEEEEEVIPETIQVPVEDNKAVESIETQTTDSSIDTIPNKESSTEEQQLIEEDIIPIKIDLKLSEIDTTEDTINFEPLHTTDYFASQGIKLSEEVTPTDKLGKQLKSFTEWLKVMKKIHTEETIELNPASDTMIQKLAEKSNTEDIVVTEAMAEVFLQQGKTNKALEVYQKLSLLNPSKSAYFAAKIEQLKG